MTTEKPYTDDQYPEEEDIMINARRVGGDFNTIDMNVSGIDMSDEFEAYQDLCIRYPLRLKPQDNFEQCHDDYDDEDERREFWESYRKNQLENL